MKVLVLGATGFIGGAMSLGLQKHHEVVCASRRGSSRGRSNHMRIDTECRESVLQVLLAVQPDVVINATGVVGQHGQFSNNFTGTENLLMAVSMMPRPVKRVIICGSAAVYGRVEDSNRAVPETHPLRGTSDYAMSKVSEEETANAYYRQQGVPVTVLRIFNAIGPGMGERFLVSNVLRQIGEIVEGHRSSIIVDRLDSLRDYVSIHDLVTAVHLVISGTPKEFAYNVGSGNATSNAELIRTMLNYAPVPAHQAVIERDSKAQTSVAGRADTSRIEGELLWRPATDLESAVKEIMQCGIRDGNGLSRSP